MKLVWITLLSSSYFCIDVFTMYIYDFMFSEYYFLFYSSLFFFSATNCQESRSAHPLGNQSTSTRIPGFLRLQWRPPSTLHNIGG